MPYTLYSAKGCGSAIVEIILLRLGIPYSNEWLTWGKFGEGDYQRLNPLQQVPTLKAGTEIITESLAICHWLNTKHQGQLIPSADSPRFSDYHRWSVYLVAAIYPTFFYGDHPERWVTGEAAQKELRDSTNKAREKMWLQVEQAAQGTPYFLGTQESIIDAYIAVMVHWRPRQDWFQTHAPRLASIAKHMAKDPTLRPVFAQFEN